MTKCERSFDAGTLPSRCDFPNSHQPLTSKEHADVLVPRQLTAKQNRQTLKPVAKTGVTNEHLSQHA